MYDFIVTVLVVFGALFVSGIIAYAVALGYRSLVNHLYFIRQKRKIHNRFNGTPTAKCRCVECEYWNLKYTARTEDETNSGICECTGHATPDFHFCYEAQPKTKESYLKERSNDM